MTGPSVLFLGHGGERTGPPVFLANLQRWWAGHDPPAFATVLARGGPLIAEYRRWGPVRVLEPHLTPARLVQQAVARSGRIRSAARIGSVIDARAMREWRQAPLVYLNTASPATLRALRHVSDRAKVVSHVHELEVALRYQLSDSDRALLLERTDRFHAASHAVAENLVTRHGVAPSRIEVHYEFVEPVTPLRREGRRAERAHAGIDPDAFVVGGSGMTEWRKGPDLFVQLASELRARTDRPLAFVWVGGATAGPTWWPLDHEAHHLGVDDIVHFVGHHDDPWRWFAIFDAFAVTSREDAFPLAALEVATAAVPLVSFDTGGIAELLDAGAGAVVRYPDLGAFADVLAHLAGDEPARRSLGDTAAALVRERHLTDVGAPLLVDAIKALMA